MGHKWSKYLLLALAFSIVFEGALRKWLVPEALHPIMYLLKDGVAIAAILGVVPIPRWGGAVGYSRASMISVCLLVPLGIGIFTFPSGAILTFKNAVLWIAAAPVIAKHARQVNPLTLSKAVFFLALLECALGVLQYSSPIDSPVNRYAWTGGEGVDAIARFGALAVVRATGTFSYITGYSTFAVVTASWACYRLAHVAGEAEFRLCVLTTIFSLGSALASGSRSAVYMIVYCAIVLLVTVSRGSVRLRLSVGLLAAAVVFLAAGGASVLESFMQRSEMAGDSFWSRVFGAGGTFLEDLVVDPIGGGLGTQSQLVSFEDSRRAGVTTMTVIEDGRARAVREAGVFAIPAILLSLVPIGIACRRRLAGGRRMLIGVLCVGVPLIWVVSGVLWFDHNGTALWWSLFGLWLGSDSVAHNRIPGVAVSGRGAVRHRPYGMGVALQG